MEKKISNCGKCGKELQVSFVKACEAKVFYNDSSGGCHSRLDTPFNRETGKENIAEQMQCPDWRRFFNSHDKIIRYEGENHWL